jgi:sugar lactone lactonase YvrE
MALYPKNEPQLPSHVVQQFPMPTWIENLAVRSNGQLLVTVITTPELHLVDPADTSRSRLIHHFPELSGLSGVIEVERDVFYVTGAKFDLQTFQTEPGTSQLWKVDMAKFDREDPSAVEKVMTLSEMRLPNGFALLSEADRTILAADSEVGVIFKIDLQKGTHSILIDVPETKIAENPHVPIGANGVKFHQGYIYWSSTSKALFCRVKVSESGEPTGDVETLEQGFVCDDFCFDSAGNVWFAQNVINTIGVRKHDGPITIAVGSNTELTVAGSTACQFDRKSGNEHILYVVTTGGLGAPVNGSEVEGGKVVAVDTSGFK